MPGSLEHFDIDSSISAAIGDGHESVTLDLHIKVAYAIVAANYKEFYLFMLEYSQHRFDHLKLNIVHYLK